MTKIDILLTNELGLINPNIYGEERPTTVNWWFINDGKYESNEVGTHEFIDFCKLVNAEPYFALNATTTSVLEARNWIEYVICHRDQQLLPKKEKRMEARIHSM